MVNPKTIRLIKNWKYLGKLYMPNKVFGKATNKFRCPSCRSDLIIYHRGGIYKIKCMKCNYERIDNKIVTENIKEEELFRLIVEVI